jgi:hypothetical protein
MCFVSGAERNRWPLCRTILALITTRRDGDLNDRANAAERPLPKREPPGCPSRPKPMPACPLSCGPHDLADKTLRLDRAAPFVADAAGTNARLMVTRFHLKIRAFETGDGSRHIDGVRIFAKTPARGFARGPTSPSPTATSARRQSVLLSQAVACLRVAAA